jgi:rhodanese-related sulfurtransferase
MKVYNINRLMATRELVKSVDGVWISIGEPDCPDSKPLPSDLHLDFWDITEPLELKDETLEPITRDQAAELVTFLEKHRNKNVIVNCKAGISRSGAVARFCEDYLGYEWDSGCKLTSQPNITVYNLMKAVYISTC